MSMLPLARFRPKLLDALQGYSRARLIKDVGAGLTVGVVALPLAMAFAIASGLKPESGIFTAIIAGFLISLLGGSRVQIGGPAGAFIVIVYGIVDRYGVANLILATALSGVLLFAMGLFKLGSLIRFIPVAVVIGFTNGIAVLIALSQIKDFLGLHIASMPADFWGIVRTVWQHLDSFNPVAVGMSSACLLLLVLWQFVLPRQRPPTNATPSLAKLSAVPGSIVVLALATTATAWLDLPLDTIGSRFGGIPATLPALNWPAFSWDSARHLLVPTFTLTLLGAIESLLCARVADSMIDDRHDPNQELMAQGVANFVTPFFGGMPATGTIARTVTNAKNGASSPIAGMTHALTLLLVILVAAPLAFHVPLAALSAILMFVAWNMGEWREFVHLRQFRLPYRVTLLAVFFLTVVVDLTVAVEVGLFAACITFIYRISSLSRSEAHSLTPAVQAHRLYGALFFGAVQIIEDLEQHLPTQALLLDLKNLIYMDSSGADAMHNLIKTCHKQRVRLVLCGLAHQPRDMLHRSGLLALLASEDQPTDWAAGLAAVGLQPTPQATP